MRRLLPLVLLVLAAGCTREPEAAPNTPNGSEGLVGKDGKPLGELATPEDLAKKADVPIYPGATMPENRSNIKRDGPEARYEIILLTKDKPEKVFAFYKEKLPRGEMIGTQYMPRTPKGNFGSISAEPEGDQTRVTIVIRATEN